ncbi:MAG: hypothetical protein RJA70_4062 [Pseudomonadota bacterium]|jgi:3-oxoacyl-[acyl-carrier protein] reductase
MGHLDDALNLVVVTGANRGIGQATAQLLAARGQRLALIARSVQSLERTRDLCSAVQVDCYACDLAYPDQVKATAESIRQTGNPTALINNAGSVIRSHVEALAVADYERQMNTNLLAPMLLAREFLPGMRAAGRGRIINVGSISGTLGSAGQSVYNASKWALTGFTKSLAAELSDSGLMTLVVLPGSVDTRMLSGSGYAPRMSAQDVAMTLVHYALDAPLAHNGGVIEMLGT